MIDKRALDTLKAIHQMYGKGLWLQLGATKLLYANQKGLSDGAVEGEVWRVLGLGGAAALGSFRIEADGSVARFPGLGRAHLKKIKGLGACPQATR